MDHSASNVIQFPVKNTKAFSRENLEQLKEIQKNEKLEVIDEMSADIVEDIFFKLYTLGIDCTEDEYIKDIILFEQSLRSLLMRTANMPHFLQDLADKLVTIGDRHEEEMELGET